MTDEYERQAAHAAIFGETAKQFMAAAVQFAKGSQATFSPEDVAKLYVLAGVWLMTGALGPPAAAALLREVADGIERGKGPLLN